MEEEWQKGLLETVQSPYTHKKDRSPSGCIAMKLSEHPTYDILHTEKNDLFNIFKLCQLSLGKKKF